MMMWQFNGTGIQIAQDSATCPHLTVVARPQKQSARWLNITGMQIYDMWQHGTQAWCGAQNPDKT